MRILITGGTGLIGRATVDVLLRHGHQARVLSRHAGAGPRDGLTAISGSVTDPASLAGAADECDAVLHVTGIVREDPPEVTFERVNVQGTSNVIAEAERAGVRRFVYVSSLGANRGSSGYHRSKRKGEELARRFTGEWVIVRPGNVYGPGDDVISRLLEWVRTSPVVPVLGTGEDAFQPVWAGDVAAALVAILERDDMAGRVLEVAGPDRTTLNGLLDLMVTLTGRSPIRLPVPATAASAGISVAAALGIELPVNDAQLRMLLERNVITDDSANALTTVLGLVSTPLENGLRLLAEATPDQLPSEGFGPMQRRTFHGETSGSEMSAEQLITKLRLEFRKLMPGIVEAAAEQGTATRLYEGATLTLGLPLRGHIQVRVADVAPAEVTLLTLKGHPLAGAVRFRAERAGDVLHFEVQVYERAASATDFALMALGGSFLQAKAWEDLVEAVLKVAGGTPAGAARSDSATLTEEQAAKIEKWLAGLAERTAPGTSGRSIPELRVE
ncbi:MAG TPA: complex I NDUFA9 subunit family protein [Gemmatimonadaceae bacterium]|nr:complex I NDUFA9 subunit family protein [Gemmatimonadaceae bacterium]